LRYCPREAGRKYGAVACPYFISSLPSLSVGMRSLLSLSEGKGYATSIAVLMTYFATPSHMLTQE
jgi:hypothetical protein